MSVVQNMLCAPSSGCFIYSLGDGLFMSRVLSGIAMLNNGGILMSLGKLGFLLGLLLTAAKGIMTQKLDLAPMLVGLIVFFGMFGSTTQVTVMDMGGAPGVSPGGAFPVGNVPYGIALAGSMVSNMGLDLAEEMEQAFGLPSGAGGIADGGFGESLRWIDAVRNWDLPEINNNNGDVGWFKSNLSNYLGDCFMNAVDKGQADVALTFQAQNPWGMGNSNTGGIGVNNMFLTTQLRDANGVHPTPCSQAYGQLNAQSQNMAIYSEFANSLFPRGMKMPGGAPVAAQALTQSFSDVNMGASQAQSYVYATALQSAWTEMLRHNGNNSPLDALGDIMVSQAAQQRATQWAASESMFRRVAQPMIAFFESMFYACAPFMALCLGFGAWGTQMIGRYLILSIWVMLWFPVLSIINLFQLTMVQHAVNAMQASGALWTTSVAGVAYLQSQIVDWMSTGAMLASATPAITLMLIFGGAVTASALAGRMGGEAHVDPKVVSPDAVRNGAALENAAQWTGTQAGGVTRSGSEALQPSMSLTHSASVARQSTDRERGIAAEQFNAQWGEKVATNWAANHSGGVNASHSTNTSASEGESRVATLLRSKGVNVQTGSEQGWAAVAAVAAKAGGDVAMKFAEGLGLTAGVSGQSQTENSQRAKEAFQEMGDNKSLWAHDMNVATAQSIGDMAAQNASIQGGKSSSVAGDESFTKGLSDVHQKEAIYQNAASVEDSAKMSQSMPVMKAAHALLANPAAAAQLADAAHNLGGSAAVENRKALASGDIPWASASDAQNNIAADILTLQGNHFGGGNLPTAYAGDRAEALMSVAQQAGFVGASTGGEEVARSNASRNQGVSSGVAQGRAASIVESHPLGSPVSADATKREATQLESGTNAPAALATVIGHSGAGAVNNVDSATLADPNGHGATKIAAQESANTDSIKPVAQKARHDKAWNEEQSGTGQTAQFVGRVASMFAHPVDGVYKRGTGFSAALTRADSGNTEQDPGKIASTNETYDLIGRNPGQLINASAVSSPEMARALTTVATFKQTGRVTPQMARQFSSDMLNMSQPDQDAVADYANSLTANELLPSSVTAAAGGPVSGVTKVEPGKYR